RFAGAAAQMKDALIVNPYDQDSVVDALRRALNMPIEERRERWQALQANVSRDNIDAWRDSFLAVLESAKPAHRNLISARHAHRSIVAPTALRDHIPDGV